MAWFKIKEQFRNSILSHYWLSIISVISCCLLLSFLLFDQFVLQWFLGFDFSHPINTIGLVMFGLTIDILLPIPSSIIAVKASSTLGMQAGFLVIWAGLNLSCLFAYYLGLSANKFLLNEVSSQTDQKRARQFIQRFGLFAIVLLRAVPVLAETSVIAAGMARMPRLQFSLATISANAGIALVYAYLGDVAGAQSSIALLIFAGLSVPLLALSGFKLYEYTQANTSKSKYAKSKYAKSKRANRETLKNITENTMEDRKQVIVNFDYSLKFTQGVFKTDNTLLVKEISRSEKRRHKVVCYCDAACLSSRKQLASDIKQYFAAHCSHLELLDAVIEVPGGEAGKTMATVETLHKHMLKVGLDRHSAVLAIGGGAVLDTVGYAAATFHRGIRLVRLPTTVLAQNDAGVGVKNGVNAYGLKNLLGSFAPPFAVINDSDFLNTLTLRDRRSGLAEAIKVAAIRDTRFFNWIEANIDQLRPREGELSGAHFQATDYMIKRCAELHLNQILQGGDPFEMGSARPLDYGHWAAHKIESLTNYSIKHGEAVAIGMALDTRYAANIGLLPQAEAERFIQVIEGLGFDIWHPSLALENDGTPVLLVALEEFRQHLGGQLCISLLNKIGEEISVNEINTDQLLNACKTLKVRQQNNKPQQSESL